MASTPQQNWLLPLDGERATLTLVGGKALNLSKLARAGLPVPGGFFLTTNAYDYFVRENGLEPELQRILGDTQLDDPAALDSASNAIRARFAGGDLPADLAGVIGDAYDAMGNGGDPAVAVRSSATAEDLPEHSFAGQQDTFLNVIGRQTLLEAVVACWSSLWTARAIAYRHRNQIAQEQVALAVIVQQMVQSEASGVLFTANPLTGKRDEMVIDATVGLGEALVSGQVEPDHYVVEAVSGRVLQRKRGAKALSIRGQPGGGTMTVAEETGNHEAIADDVIGDLVRLGRRVANLYEAPQDIEWARANGQLYLLQSRPITTLYPLPGALPPPPQESLRVLLSFGAVQGMLEPMTPLGRDLIKTIFASAGVPFGYRVSAETQRALFSAGERLFINITVLLQNRLGRAALRQALPLVEPTAAQALQTLWTDPRLVQQQKGLRPRTAWRLLRGFSPIIRRFLATMRRPDEQRQQAQKYVEDLVADFEQRMKRATDLQARLRIMREMLEQTIPGLLQYVVAPIAASMASLRLLRKLTAANSNSDLVLALTRGLPHNVTTEMDVALWQTAQQIRADAAALRQFQARDAAELTEQYRSQSLPAVAQEAIAVFMNRYGMRGVGEIDIGRARWRDDPRPVMLTVKSYLQISDPQQAPEAVLQRGRRAAQETVGEITVLLRPTRLGWLKARLARVAARRVRALAGMRETPKFTVIRLMGLMRAALLDSGQELVHEGRLERAADVFYLTFSELSELAAGRQQPWRAIIARRRAQLHREQKRTQIPRLMLSDGTVFYEGINAGKAGAPADGTLVGDAVSPGVAEGTVRVVFDPHAVQLAPGEILVCPGTDPAWTPLFVAAGALVMEVGGLMTHGSVVAREYGIPAVVGVDRATSRLQDGQRVRVDGSSGHIQIVESGGATADAE